MTESEILDLFVIGGGINGAGIARDAAGRGLSVMLCEKDDLAEGHVVTIREARPRRFCDILNIMSFAWYAKP